MSDITLESYLKSDPKVAAAKAALTKAAGALEAAQKAANANVPGGLSPAAKKDIAARVAAAQAALDTAKANQKTALDAAKAYYAKNADTIVGKAKSDIDIKIAEQEASMARAAKAGLDTKPYQVQIAKLKAQKTGVKVETPPGGSLTPDAPLTASDFMKDYTLSSNGVVTGPDGKQIYLVPVKDAKGKETLTPFYSQPSARDAFLKGYSAAQLKTFKSTLVSKGFLTSKEFAAGDWLMGVDRMLLDYTASAVKSVKYEGAKNTPSIAAWFKTSSATGSSGSGTVASKAGTETTAYLDLTTVGDANKEINDYMMDNLGIEATAEQKAAYYTDIHNRELASTRSVKNVKDAQGNTISSTGTGAPVTQAERDSVMSGFVIQALSVADPKTLLASTKGSKVATDITALRSTALDYGMALTDTELLRYVKEGFGQTDYLKKTQDRIRQLAITTMPNLAAHIQGGGTVRDVADRYAAYKQQKLGVMVGDSIADKSIMDAINNPKGLLSISDWNRQMQADPLWGKTEEAMGIGTDFIKHFMQSFGMVG